jgi:hypothetical protein
MAKRKSVEEQPMTQPAQKGKRKPKRITFKQVLRERDECSQTAMELIKLVQDLADKLRDTRLVMADAELVRSQKLLDKIMNGGKFKP